MRVYQFRHVGAVLPSLLYYCSTLPSNSATISGFAILRQTNFRLPFAGAATDSHRFVAGCAVFEESESIADQWQMSKGHDAIVSVIIAGMHPRTSTAARFGRQVRRIPASSVTLRVKTCQSNHCADSRPTHWLNKIKKTI
jgi:hypothetical protein